MRSALLFRTTLAALIAIAGTTALAAKLKPYDDALAKEARSAELCEAVEGRIFVTVERGSECVAYFATKGSAGNRSAVIFLDGDINLERYQDQKRIATNRTARQKFLQTWADKLGRRYIEIYRLGINGSSGNHGDRRRPHESVVINEALEILKKRLGLDRLVLAGQSGGSTIAASLLTFGRADISCAVLGSGAFEVVDLDLAFRRSKGSLVTRDTLARSMYDPSQNIDGVAKDPARRIFVLGDEADQKTPFAQQVRFTNALRKAGHHARVFPIDARGETDHDTARMTIPVAGACARGDSDDKIYEAIPKARDRRSNAADKSLAGASR